MPVEKDIIAKIEELNPDAIVLTGYDECIAGICSNIMGTVLLYDESKIIKQLMKEMTEHEAWEFYDFNILGAYYGQYGPMFLTER